MRITVLALTAALVLAPVAMSVSTREVHHTYYDVFTPEDADVPAEPRDATVNCGDRAVDGQSSHDKMAEKHDGNSEFGAVGENDAMACWDSKDHNLWTQSTADGEKIVAASGPFYTCKADGVDLDIAFQNPFPIYEPEPTVPDPDYAPEDNGVLVSTGSFYVIPELSGANAEDVEAIWFSFLETTPTLAGEAGGGSDALCASGPSASFPAGGAYYEFYRGDDDRSDGWTIPVNTLLVPDNAYGAKLTFLGEADAIEGETSDLDQPYPGGLEVLANGYVYAIVDNNKADEEWSPCEPTRLNCDFQDITPPWPQILPGDVPQSSTDLAPNEVVVTFGEHVDDVDFTVNYADGGSENPQVPGKATHDVSDVDSFPLTTQQTDKWGEKLTYSLGQSLSPCDEIVVTATDTHGNEATKTVLADEPACNA